MLQKGGEELGRERWANLERERSGRDRGRSVKGGWREKCEEPEEFAALPPGPMCPSSQLNELFLAVQGCDFSGLIRNSGFSDLKM